MGSAALQLDSLIEEPSINMVPFYGPSTYGQSGGERYMRSDRGLIDGSLGGIGQQGLTPAYDYFIFPTYPTED